MPSSHASSKKVRIKCAAGHRLFVLQHHARQTEESGNVCGFTKKETGRGECDIQRSENRNAALGENEDACNIHTDKSSIYPGQSKKVTR